MKKLLIDVHAHMNFPSYDDDREKVLKDCEESGVRLIVTNGTDPKSNRETQALCDEFSILKPAYGFYPVHVAEEGIEKVHEEIKWIKQHKPVAIGEVGLDYFVGDDNPNGGFHKETQKEAFKLFIHLAKELDIPIIIHSRKAESDVLDVLEEESAKKVILHCFMGKRKFAERAIKLGYNFSLPVVAIKLEQMQWIIKHAPLQQLLTETDSPYLAPVRGDRNSPKHVELVIDKIAEIKGMDAVEVANQVFFNYQRLF